MATDPRCFEVRSAVLAHIDGVFENKPRPCVVLRVEVDFVEVCYGQGTGDKNRGDIEVVHGSGDARRFKCTKTTYFRSTNIAHVPRDRVIAYLGMCSSTMFLACERFARDRHLASAPVAPGPTIARAPTPREPLRQQPQQQLQHVPLSTSPPSSRDDDGSGGN